MLFDRMCPGGGWNAGNPLVYGVPGKPAVSPTVWALLALRHALSRTEVIQSLDWLESVHGSILGPGSIALSHICLEAFGRSTEVVEGRLQTCHESNEFMGDTLAFAWAALALTPRRAWPPTIAGGEQ
jgi:hypothetical protein